MFHLQNFFANSDNILYRDVHSNLINLILMYINPLLYLPYLMFKSNNSISVEGVSFYSYKIDIVNQIISNFPVTSSFHLIHFSNDDIEQILDRDFITYWSVMSLVCKNNSTHIYIMK
jgi:hypothetical protein